MKKVLAFLYKNPEIIFFICAFILWTGLMCWSNSKEGGDFSWHDLKVEANGMIFDLFVFGILVTIYNAVRARKEKIERLQEEIDDYRWWQEKEAMYRILGAIRRLNKEGVSRIELQHCTLSGAHLLGVNLTGATFSLTVLNRTDFTGADLSTANFVGAFNLSSATLKEAFVMQGWFEKLDQWNVIDKEIIKKKYIIDETGRLQIK